MAQTITFSATATPQTVSFESTAGGLRRVAMPADTAADGAQNQVAWDAKTLAVYLPGTGWLFADLYQK